MNEELLRSSLIFSWEIRELDVPLVEEDGVKARQVDEAPETGIVVEEDGECDGPVGGEDTPELLTAQVGQGGGSLPVAPTNRTTYPQNSTSPLYNN